MSQYWLIQDSMMDFQIDRKGVMKDVRLQEVNTLAVNIISSLDVSPDGNYFSLVTRRRAKTSSMYDYELGLYDIHKLLKMRQTFLYSSYSISKHPCEVVAGDGLVAVALADHIVFYNSGLEQVSKMLHGQDNVYGLASSPNGQMVALVGDNKILIWDTFSFRSIRFPHEEPMARNCEFSADNRYLGISTTTTLRVYELIAIGEYLMFELRGVTPEQLTFGLINSFSFNPLNSKMVVVGFSNISPRKFDFSQSYLGFQTLFERGEQPAYYENPKFVSYMPDGKRVVSSDYNEGVGLWAASSSVRPLYRQNYLLFGLKPFDRGSKLIGYVWQHVKIVEIQLRCQEGAAYSNECKCEDPSQYWDPSSQECQSCAMREGQACECPSAQAFNPSMGQCVVKCSQIAHAVPDGQASPSECFCRRGYFWIDGACVFSCQQIQFGLELVAAEECSCARPFMWDQARKICQCPPFSSFNPTSPNFCDCDPFHYIDAQTGQCLPDCTKITFADLFSLAEAGDARSCPCEEGYIFREYDLAGSGRVTQGCVKDCSALVDTLEGTYSVSQCKCEQGTEWLISSCQVACGKIGNAIEEIENQETGQILGCKCAMNHLWVPENRECGKSCSSVPNVNHSEYSTSIACPCNSNFNWDEHNNQCMIDCRSMQFTQPFAESADVQSCVCIDNFLWDLASMSCLVNCSGIWDAQAARLSQGTCACKQDKEFNQTSMICETPQEEVFKKPWVWGFLVFGLVFVLIITAVLVKFCMGFSKEQPNKEHQKKLKRRVWSKKSKQSSTVKESDKDSDVNTERIVLS